MRCQGAPKLGGEEQKTTPVIREDRGTIEAELYVAFPDNAPSYRHEAVAHGL
jgi:hypothetical protein